MAAMKPRPISRTASLASADLPSGAELAAYTCGLGAGFWLDVKFPRFTIVADWFRPGVTVGGEGAMAAFVACAPARSAQSR